MRPRMTSLVNAPNKGNGNNRFISLLTVVKLNKYQEEATHYMESTGERFEYEMYFEGKMVLCRIEAGESNYGVHFDNKLVAVIELQ